MTNWDRYPPQVMGAYSSTQHSTTGVSPHMMLTGHEKSLPLTFFYPEYEGKKTSPQVYARDVIRRQQELNDLCRRNTQQAQASQRIFRSRYRLIKMTGHDPRRNITLTAMIL